MQNGIEVRNKPDSDDVDEVLLWIDGKCVFHLEYMDDNQIWMGLYGKHQMAHVRQGSPKPIQTVVDETETTEEMKIGDTVYVLAKPDGTILGNGDGNIMSTCKELVEDELKNGDYLGSLNDCDMSQVTIRKLVLEPKIETNAKLTELTRKARAGDDQAAKELVAELAKMVS
jgi:hypothetical protein